MQDMYLDIPRIYTALAEWSACLIYLLIFERRMHRIKNIFLCTASLVLQSIFLVFTGNLDTFFWIPGMLGAAAMMFVFLHFGLKKSALAVCFLCAKAFLLAEFVASLEWQLHVFIFGRDTQEWQSVQMIFMLCIYFTLFLFMFLWEKRWKIEEFAENITKKECFSAAAIAVISFAVSNLSFVFSNTPFTSTIQADIFNIRTLMDLCGIAIMFVLQSQIQELLSEKELTAINRALKSQYEQYRNYQENFEMMNMKYHDIKHQIEGLRAETDIGKRNAWLDEIEKELNNFSEAGHTGSHVLDGILAAKSQYCKKKNIKITCVAEGTILHIIHVRDLCTIFGNALDNAIESVSLVSDEVKRLIHLSVSRQRQFIYIQIENYCESDLRIGKDNLPVTSKQHPKEHGYGMKSIKQSAEKYGGSIVYRLKENWFELKILIPYHE